MLILCVPQRLCEELEYSELLDRVVEINDPFDRMVVFCWHFLIDLLAVIISVRLKCVAETAICRNWAVYEPMMLISLRCESQKIIASPHTVRYLTVQTWSLLSGLFMVTNAWTVLQWNSGLCENFSSCRTSDVDLQGNGRVHTCLLLPNSYPNVPKVAQNVEA